MRPRRSAARPAAAAASRASGSPSAKSCSLTEKMSAKSVASSSAELERERLHATGSGRSIVVLHAVADEALARDRERVLRQPAGERVAQVERGGEVLDLARREQQRPLAVDGQPQQREEARVVREQAAASRSRCRRARRRCRRSSLRGSSDAIRRRRTIRTARRLGERLDDDLVDVHVRRPREREEDAVGDVLGGRAARRSRRPRAPSPRRRGSARARTSVSTRPGVDRRDADRPAEQILAQRVGEAAHGELRGDVDGARSRTACRPGDRAHVDDVPAVAQMREAEARHPERDR